LLAAVRTHLLSQIGIQEPTRSKLVLRQPRCDWIVAWGLYALTQPGLSRNKAGYVNNRLWDGDPPPAELLELAGLRPSVQHLFCRAIRRGDDRLIPGALRQAFLVWHRHLASLCDLLLLSPAVPDVAEREELPEQTWLLPAAIAGLLLGDEEISEESEGWAIRTRDLHHAVCLARAVRGGDWEQQIEVFYGAGGQRYALNAEVLALSVEPLSRETWDTVRQELQWQMARGVFDRWWREVQPLGIATGPAATPCVVLGTPTADVRDWIVSKQMPIVARTLAGVLGQAVDVRIEVYAEPLPVASLAQGD
jgi:hypothetical protein